MEVAGGYEVREAPHQAFLPEWPWEVDQVTAGAK